MSQTYSSEDSKSTLPLALAYIAKHPKRFLFPLRAGRKGKPRIKDNLAQASNDPAQLAAWARQFLGCMWGLSLAKSGLIAVDVDTGNGKVGLQSYKELKAAGFAFPKTETQRTPSGGLHALYSGEHKFSQGRIGKDIDTPNYIVIAGCVRYDGKAYTVGIDAPVVPVPEWLTAKLKPPVNRQRRERNDDAVPLDWFRRALKATPYTGGPAGLDDRHGYGGWLDFAMACHEAAGGDEADYMHAFIEWSLDDPSPDWKQPTSYEYVERKWLNFNDDRDDAVTRGSWLKVLNDIGQGQLAAELGSSAASDFATDPLTEDDLAELGRLGITRDCVSEKDFVFSLPDNEFIFVPSGANKLWSGESVNLTCVGPMIVDPVLARELKTHEAAKAFAKSDEGWTEVGPDKPKSPKWSKAESAAMRNRFAGGLDIDLDFDENGRTKSKPENDAPPTPPKSEARQRIERLVILLNISPQILRAWLLKYGIFMPNNSWSEVARMSATAAIVGDKERHIAEISWWPGKPSVIRDVLIRNEGGIIPIRGTNTFNRYRPALLKRGNFPPPTLWLDHVNLIYPDDAQHIIQWLAWRVQRPDVKILHALILGGATRIGKDTLIHPLDHAIGPWNFKTATAQYIMDEPKYNDYLEAVVCLVSEGRDFGKDDRYAFYERTKPWLGGTAKDVLMAADKFIRVHPVMDVWGMVITTNFKVRGLFIPEDDERHYAAWSNRTWEDWGFATREELSRGYFKPLYDWYDNGGKDAVAHYLMNLPLVESFPKAPPPKTAAWYEIVNAYADPEKSKLMGVLDGMGDPPAVTVNEVGKAGKDVLDWFGASERNTIPAAFEDAGYSHQSNPNTKNGKWLVGAKRRAATIYVKSKLTSDERVKAANEVYARLRKAVAGWEADPANTVDPLG